MFFNFIYIYFNYLYIFHIIFLVHPDFLCLEFHYFFDSIIGNIFSKNIGGFWDILVSPWFVFTLIFMSFKTLDYDLVTKTNSYI